MEVDLITAPGDGLGPAVLLSLGTRMKAQYLFNVPEGFSRFALEHKLRPGLGLRAVFCPDLLASTGLPGLLMRLRGQGHGQVEILGPSGTLPFVGSLRHFVHWKHPAVLVSEVENLLPQQRQEQVRSTREDDDINKEDEYNDEHLNIKFIWVDSDLNYSSKSSWKTPDWLYESGDDASPHNSSSSTSSTSESSQSASSDDDNSRSSSSEEEEEQEGEEKTAPAVFDTNDSNSMFTSLDAAFVKVASGGAGSRLRTQALGLLKSSSKASQKPVAGKAKNKGGGGDGGGGGRLLSVLAALQETAVPSDPNTRHVGNRVYTRCDADGISLFARENRSGTKDAALSSSLVAFLCLLKASNQVMLIINCRNEDQIRHIQTHPALRAMTSLPKERHAGCILMLGPGLSYQQPAQDLSATLQQSPPTSPSNPSLFILEHPGVGSRSSDLGYISSARMVTRLNMANQRMFPLPVTLRMQQRQFSDPRPPPTAVQNTASRQQHEQRETENRIYLSKLTKIVWSNGKLAIKPKAEAGIEEEEEENNTAEADDYVDVEKLQATVHDADPELKLKLHQITESLPPAYRNQFIHNKTAEAAGGASVGAKRALENEVKESDGNKRAAASLQAKLRQSNGTAANAAVKLFKPPPPPISAFPSQEPEVVFLGTGSAEPSQHRGASAIYLNPGNGYAGFLLDCGEGCYGQLVRFHGPQAASALISNLSGIWISHRHADHMAGILQILAHHPFSLPPLFLIGPRSLQKWLSEAAPAVGLTHRYTYAHCSEVQQPHHWGCHRICSSLGLLGLATVPVRHCSDAFGIVLRHHTGWSLVYSGDTEPSEALVRAGAGATLLIHEATFEPLLINEARKKRHSTSVEAMDVARRMGAYSTVLTHFSQRYPKFPEGVSEAVAARVERGEGSSFGVAFDGMCLPLGLLAHLPAVTVAVEAVLAAAAVASEKEKERKGERASFEKK
jgi:ribonuclease Z